VMRMEEMRESTKIMRQCIEKMPAGPVVSTDNKVVPPRRGEMKTSMEALIHHFKLVTEGFRVPPGEAYFPIEGPRGELGCFVRADGSGKPLFVGLVEAAVAALGAIGDPAGLPAVLAALDDKPAIRRRAAVALAAFDGPDTEAALRRCLEDRDWQVRQVAEDLLDVT